MASSESLSQADVSSRARNGQQSDYERNSLISSDSGYRESIRDNESTTHRSLSTQSPVCGIQNQIGIQNHGNTCFMSAIIQCLCNTDPLAEYFVMNHYRIDLQRHNKLHAKKYGTKGEVTEQFALLLKSLWSCQYTSDISNKFKLLVAKYGSQYEGNDQHDAQEFLLWLLDKIHEDLNIATKKKYRKVKVRSQTVCFQEV